MEPCLMSRALAWLPFPGRRGSDFCTPWRLCLDPSASPVLTISTLCFFRVVQRLYLKEKVQEGKPFPLNISHPKSDRERKSVPCYWHLRILLTSLSLSWNLTNTWAEIEKNTAMSWLLLHNLCLQKSQLWLGVVVHMCNFSFRLAWST